MLLNESPGSLNNTDLADWIQYAQQLLTARATAAPAAQGDALPVAAKSHGAWDGLETLADLPDGTELYAHPPAAQGDALDVEIAALESSCAHLGRLVDELQPDAERYQYLRERDLDTIRQGGVFAGRTPDNVVLNGGDLDAAIDAARAADEEGGTP